MHVSVLILLPPYTENETEYIYKELDKVSGINSIVLNIDTVIDIFEEQKYKNIQSVDEFCNLFGLKNNSEPSFRRIIDYFKGDQLLNKNYEYIICNSVLYSSQKDNKFLADDKEKDDWRKEYIEIINKHFYDDFVLIDVHI